MRIAIVALLWQWPMALCSAQEQPNNSSAATLGEVIVEADLPGPAFWKVTRADSDHLLWVVAEPPLLPAGVEWRSKALRDLAAQSQEIISAGSFGIVPDGKVGIFRMVTLAPSVLSARKNPDGERLQDVVPPELYARWLLQKRRYLGNDRGVERWRPMFAAGELRSEALKELGTSTGSGLWGVLRQVVKEKQIKTTHPAIWIKIPPKEMRATVKQFARGTVNDIPCFERMLAFVEALSDQESIRKRAAAWVVGDVPTLRQIGVLPSYTETCDAAIASSQAAERFEVGDIRERVKDQWLEAIEKGFANNAATLATLPLREVLTDDGRLALLRNRGYTVDGP